MNSTVSVSMTEYELGQEWRKASPEVRRLLKLYKDLPEAKQAEVLGDLLRILRHEGEAE